MLRNKYYIVKTIIVFILLIAVSSQVFSQEKKPVKAPVKVNSASSKNITGSTKPVAKKPQVTKSDSSGKAVEHVVSDSLKTVKPVQKKPLTDSLKKATKKFPADSLFKSKSTIAKKTGAKTTANPVRKTLKDSTKTLVAGETVQKKSITDSIKRTVKKTSTDSLLKSKSSVTKKPGAKTTANPVKKTVQDSTKTLIGEEPSQKKPLTDSVKRTVKKTDSLLKSKSNKAVSITAKSTAAKKPVTKTTNPVKKTQKDSLTKTFTAVKSDSVNAIPVGFAVEKSNAESQKATTKSTAKKGAPVKGAGKTDPKGTKNAKTPAVKKPIMNIISANAVGVLNLGAGIDTIKKLFPKERVYRVYVYDQNNRYVQYQIVASDKVTPFLNITEDCVTDSVCLIKQILVKSPYYKTDRGVVVGNSLDDLFLAYGYLESRWEEENLIVRIGDGIDFIMDTSQIPKRWYKKMNLDRLPLPTKIVGIQISIYE